MDRGDREAAVKSLLKTNFGSERHCELPSSLLEDESHGLLAPEDLSGDSSVQFAGGLPLIVMHVVASLLDVLVDLDAIDENVMGGVLDKLHRVKECITHLLELGSILVADLGAVVHKNSDLADKLTKLVDTVCDLAVRAFLKISDSLVHIDNQWVEVSDTSVQILDVLSLDGTDKEAINELGDMNCRRVWHSLVHALHVLSAPQDGGTDSSVDLASGLPLVVIDVFASLLDVLVDFDAIDLNIVEGLDDQFLGVEEGQAHVLELRDVLSTDLRAILKDDSNLSDELTELVDTVGNFGVRAILEISDSLLHIGDQWVKILHASLQVVNFLSFEGTNKDAIDELSNLKSGCVLLGSRGNSGQDADCETSSHLAKFILKL